MNNITLPRSGKGTLLSAFWVPFLFAATDGFAGDIGVLALGAETTLGNSFRQSVLGFVRLSTDVMSLAFTSLSVSGFMPNSVDNVAAMEVWSYVVLFTVPFATHGDTTIAGTLTPRLSNRNPCCAP